MKKLLDSDKHRALCLRQWLYSTSKETTRKIYKRLEMGELEHTGILETQEIVEWEPECSSSNSEATCAGSNSLRTHLT